MKAILIIINILFTIFLISRQTEQSSIEKEKQVVEEHEENSSSVF